MEATLTYYHLGSWTTITDAEGNLEQEASFDAWGNIRSASDWTSPMSEKLLFDRGYTSHEHLYFYGRYYHPNAPHTDLSLINMNGRMYDPIMSSFLSVDNYVQSPENSQNFNRYAYCLNNPLKYTDPDGEWFLTFGLDYGKNSNGNFGVTGLSLGINFGTFGFGTHFNWGNGFTAGLYGEVGPHIGCAGVNATLGFDYNFTYGTSTLSLSGGYGASYGIGRASLGGNVSYTFGLPQGVSGFNANIMAGLGLAGNINKYGQQAGFGLSASYGTQGFGFGAHTYCEMIPLQEKLDRIVKYYEAELSEQFGDAGVGNVYAGTKRNLRNTKRLSLDGPFLVDENGRHAYGAHVPGNALEEQIEIDGILCKRMKDNDIYISKRTIQEIWHGNDVAVETLFHEWQHSSDYYSGCADYYFKYYGMSNEACSNWLELNAYSLNYSRCPTQRYYNRVVKYNDAINNWNRIYGN